MRWQCRFMQAARALSGLALGGRCTSLGAGEY